MFGFFNKCGCGCNGGGYDNREYGKGGYSGDCGYARQNCNRPKIDCEKECKKVYEVKEIDLCRNKYEIKFEENFRPVGCRKFFIDDEREACGYKDKDFDYDEQKVNCGEFRHDKKCGRQ